MEDEDVNGRLVAALVHLFSKKLPSSSLILSWTHSSCMAAEFWLKFTAKFTTMEKTEEWALSFCSRNLFV
jgi:hypothetical protein